jgi:hypothetical protein
MSQKVKGSQHDGKPITFYGMADSRIGVARLELPDMLPPDGMAKPVAAAV